MHSFCFKHYNLNTIFIFTFIFIPVFLLISIQYIVIDDRFESTASLYITEDNSVKSSGFNLALLGLSSSGSTRDILVLKAFIESQTLMEKLDNDLNLLRHWSSNKYDIFSRLEQNYEREYALEYYNKRIKVDVDTEAQLLNISVQTFEREFSKKLLDRILFYSQEFVDNLNKNVSNSQLVFLDEVVKNSEEDLMEEKKNLQRFQDRNGIFSTEIATQSIAHTIANLEQKLAADQAEFNSRKGELSEKAPQLLQLNARIGALKEQIARENGRLAGGTGKTLSELDSELREIKMRVEYKTLRYKAHLEALETAQLETARRMRFLTIVSAPTLPDASLYPDRPYSILTGSILSLMLYFFVSISVAVIREHA